jgi:nicotinate phosphoribosyltransferase
MSELTANIPHTNNQERRLSDGLDFYKLTMGQLALAANPDTEVTFTLKNRAESRPLSEYVDVNELQNRFDTIREQGFTPEEIAYFASLQAENGEARFDEPYLDYLANLTLTDVDISLDSTTGELAISASGPWANVSLWETVVMSELNELYYQTYIEKNNLDEEELLAEGNRRLSEKIALLSARRDIHISDFGTRRRFSASWHEHVVGRLTRELPNNFIGTSNPWYAHTFNIKPIGTYAHEMPMVYAALLDQETGQPLEGHAQMMGDWYDTYGEDLSIALTDTFTSDFFFADFTPEQARNWHGLRHDSGDPIEFGERAIAFYNEHAIDPTTKTIVFSDGLDITTIIRLADHFSGRINLTFGWGTSLMNDLGLPANNFVMKATKANGIATVKLSDNIGKHTGPADKIHQYTAQVEEVLNAQG